MGIVSCGLQKLATRFLTLLRVFALRIVGRFHRMAITCPSNRHVTQTTCGRNDHLSTDALIGIAINDTWLVMPVS